MTVSLAPVELAPGVWQGEKRGCRVRLLPDQDSGFALGEGQGLAPVLLRLACGGRGVLPDCLLGTRVISGLLLVLAAAING